LNNYGFYEAGLDAINYTGGSSTNEGLPQGGAFTSMLDGVTTFQLGPYNANNVLFMSQSSPTGTLSLPVPQAFISLSVLASSANGGGAGSLVIKFTDGTSSPPLGYNAPDWYNNIGSAITHFGRLYLGNLGEFYADNPSGNNPNLYQTTINLRVLGLASKLIASVAFTRPGGAGTSSDTDTGIFALSGTLAPPAFQRVEQTGNTIQFTWSAAAQLTYQVQYSTNLAQTNWTNLGSVITATNSTAASSAAIAQEPARYYRVILLP
jgi:hypothetical protein